MIEAVFNALAIGTTVPAIWITLWVIGLYGPLAIETFNHFIIELSCLQITSQRMMVLGLGLLYCVLSIESVVWLTGFACELVGVIDTSSRADLYSTISFVLRQWTIICSGMLITISGLRARDPKCYVGHVGYSVLILLLGSTAVDVMIQLARAS
jgi:hypothetical protein